MALISPHTFQHILGLSFLSRLIVILLQFIFNCIIKDHNADAYKSAYFKILSSHDNSLEQSLPSIYRYSHKFIQGLIRWDSQYFLDLSKDGYISEQHLAFLPLFPMSVSFVKGKLLDHAEFNPSYLFPTNNRHTLSSRNISSQDLENYIRSGVVGIALNNFVYFPIAALSLFMLTKLVKSHDETYAKRVLWWFCFNPASIFFSSFYTESLFAALTFTALLLIEYKSDAYRTTSPTKVEAGDADSLRLRESYVPLEQLNRILYICLPCIALLALSTATRSNGLVTIGFIAYQLLMKYGPILQTGSSQDWTLAMFIYALMEFIQDILVLIMSAVIAASGYITFQIYTYIKFCHDDEKGRPMMKPDWCYSAIPHSYSHVQAKYWNVGIFKYYQLKQVPNFLLAMPVTCIILHGSLERSRVAARTISRFTNYKQLVYYIHAIVLTIFCGLSINIQVTTRLIASSCPVLYWICADMERQSRAKRRLLMIYFWSYFLVGTALHSNFYPWT